MSCSYRNLSLKTLWLLLPLCCVHLGCSSKSGNEASSVSRKNSLPDSQLERAEQATARTATANSSLSQSSQPPETNLPPTNAPQIVQDQARSIAGAPTLPPRPSVSLAAPESGETLRNEAQQLVEDLVAAFPNSPDALEVKARFHLLVGETSAARQCWELALEIDKDYGYAIYGMGKVSVLNAKFDEAVRYFSRALDGQPDSTNIVKELSNAYLKLGDVEHAIQVLTSFVTQHPQATETWVLLGQAYLSDRQFESAKTAFEKALELYPELPSAQQGLGTVLVRLGRREEASKLLEAQRANRADSTTNRTTAEIFAGEMRDYSDRFVFAARVYLGNGAVDAAERCLIRASVFNPQNIEAWTMLFDLYEGIGRLDLAVEHADRLWQKNPDSAGSAFTLGILRAKLGQVAEAKQAYREVIRLAPDSHSGYEALVRLDIQTQTDKIECLSLAQQLIAVRGNAADFELLGQAYAFHGQWDDAQAALQQAIRLDPQNQYYNLALEKLRQFRSSIQPRQLP